MPTILFFIILWLVYRRKNPDRAEPFKKIYIFLLILFIILFVISFTESIIFRLLNKKLGIDSTLFIITRFIPILPGYFYFLKRKAVKESNLEKIKACNLGLLVTGVIYLLFPLGRSLRKLGEFLMREGVKDMDILYFILGLGFLIFFGVVFWRIFKKAGYPGVWGIFIFIPLVNIFMLTFLAFTEWPIHKELGQLKENNKARSS